MRTAVGLVVGLWVSVAWAHTPSATDRIEAVQTRAWVRHGAIIVTPLTDAALDDPFLLRGGAGVRFAYWPRSLLGFGLEASGWGQTRTSAARVAQRELRARLRPSGSGWLALASAEVVAVDGKVAGFGGILPFELAVRAAFGAASSRDDFVSAPTLAMAAAFVARWFPSERVGVETSIVVRSAALQRTINGQQTSTKDTVVSFEFGVPLRFGGER